MNGEAATCYKGTIPLVTWLQWSPTLQLAAQYRLLLRPAGTASQFQEMELTVYNSLFTLIKDTCVLRDYAAAALLIVNVSCFDRPCARSLLPHAYMDLDSVTANVYIRLHITGYRLSHQSLRLSQRGS